MTYIFLCNSYALGQEAIASISNLINSAPEKHLDFLEKEPFSSLLMDRSYHRPSKCPLKSFNNKDLHTKLSQIAKALKYGECYDRNGEVIKGIEEIITNTNKAYQSRYSMSQTNHSSSMQTAGTTANPQTLNPHYTDILHSLGSISKDDDCITNLRKRGLIPVVADIATTIGQTAALVPSPNGFLISAGGLSLGATLKVITKLFSSPYNWKSSAERKQFQDLNCSFFDLRRDIESAEILIPPDETIQDNLKRIAQAKELLHKKLKEIQKIQKTTIQTFNQLEIKYIIKKISIDLFQATKQIKKLLELLERENESLNQIRNKNAKINYLMTESIGLIALVKKDSTPPDYYTYILSILKKFEWNKLKEFTEMKVDIFRSDYLEPLITYLKEYLNDLQARSSVHKQTFLENKNRLSSLSNKERIAQLEKNYSLIIKTLSTSLARLEHRYTILTARNEKKNLDSFDDSAHSTYDIIDEYTKIQDIIYNKLGYSYLKYFRKKIIQHMNYFNKYYRKFKKESKNVNNDLELSWVCRNAQQLRITWETSNSANEVIWDLFETNKGIYYTHVRKIKTFLHFIPVGLTKKYLFYRNARSAEIANNYINHGRTKMDLKKLNKYGFRSSKNIGKIMLRVEKSRSRRLKVEKFMIDKECFKYL